MTSNDDINIVFRQPMACVVCQSATIGEGCWNSGQVPDENCRFNKVSLNPSKHSVTKQIYFKAGSNQSYFNWDQYTDWVMDISQDRHDYVNSAKGSYTYSSMKSF